MRAPNPTQPNPPTTQPPTHRQLPVRDDCALKRMRENFVSTSSRRRFAPSTSSTHTVSAQLHRSQNTRCDACHSVVPGTKICSDFFLYQMFQGPFSYLFPRSTLSDKNIPPPLGYIVISTSQLLPARVYTGPKLRPQCPQSTCTISTTGGAPPIARRLAARAESRAAVNALEHHLPQQ